MAGSRQPSEPDRRWVVIYDLDAVDPPELDRVDFASGDAHGGRHALRMSAPTRVRQVADGLTPGRPVTLAARVKVEGAAARLAALGFDALDGTAEIVAESGDTGGAWRYVTLQVTPTRSWVVVSLEADGAGAVSWDDVEVLQDTVN